jgi:large subunit ribosomal protein L15e
MGMYKYLKKHFRSEEYKKIMKEKLISWRKQPVLLRIDRPTRLDRARSLGYKAKQGFVLVRFRIKKGARKRETPSGGRKPLRSGKKQMTPGMNHQHISVLRVAKKFPNLEVLNSYYVADDGRSKWFEVILVDPNNPAIKNDPKFKWISKQKRRVYRGLTSAGKKSRGLGKGKGFEKK